MLQKLIPSKYKILILFFIFIFPAISHVHNTFQKEISLDNKASYLENKFYNNKTESKICISKSNLQPFLYFNIKVKELKRKMILSIDIKYIKILLKELFFFGFFYGLLITDYKFLI